MTLCIVMAVMAGFEEDLRDRILGFNPHIVVLSHGGPFTDYEEVLAKVRAAKGVGAAAPLRLQPGDDDHADVGLGSRRARRRAGAPRRRHRRQRPRQGGLRGGARKPMAVKTLVDGEETTVEVNQVVIGFELAKLLGVGVGDWINLMSPIGSSSALGFVPRVKRFAVGGLFDSGMFDYDSTIVFLSMADAQRFFEMGPKATGIEVRWTTPRPRARWRARSRCGRAIRTTRATGWR
jgi:lipoprotein-releasing system permease protein